MERVTGTIFSCGSSSG